MVTKNSGTLSIVSEKYEPADQSVKYVAVSYSPQKDLNEISGEGRMNFLEIEYRENPEDKEALMLRLNPGINFDIPLSVIEKIREQHSKLKVDFWGIRENRWESIKVFEPDPEYASKTIGLHQSLSIFPVAIAERILMNCNSRHLHQLQEFLRDPALIDSLRASVIRRIKQIEETDPPISN